MEQAKNGFIHFELITPERVLFTQDVERVTLPTAQGEITILPQHIPLVAMLVPGIATLVGTDGTEEVAVSGGFIEVQQENRVRVLADTAERGHELDLSVIERAKTRAMQAMKEGVRADDISYAAAAAFLERELAREKIARKYHRPHHVPTIDAANLPTNENSA